MTNQRVETHQIAEAILAAASTNKDVAADTAMVIDRDEHGRMVGIRDVPLPRTTDGSMTVENFERQVEALTANLVPPNGDARSTP